MGGIPSLSEAFCTPSAGEVVGSLVFVVISDSVSSAWDVADMKLSSSASSELDDVDSPSSPSMLLSASTKASSSLSLTMLSEEFGRGTSAEMISSMEKSFGRCFWIGLALFFLSVSITRAGSM